MDRLILLRHAKAERNAPSGDDIDRRLSERGRNDARLMGKVLADAGWRPTAAWGSAAERTRETWACASEAFAALEPQYVNALYHASSGAMLRMIEADEGAPGTV